MAVYASIKKGGRMYKYIGRYNNHPCYKRIESWSAYSASGVDRYGRVLFYFFGIIVVIVALETQPFWKVALVAIGICILRIFTPSLWRILVCTIFWGFIILGLIHK